MYYYDDNGFWRCDGRSRWGDWWRRRQLCGGNGWRWRCGSDEDGEWRLETAKFDNGVLRKKVDELEAIVVKLQKEKGELREESADMKVMLAGLSDEEYRWRWWMEWRIMCGEAIMEQQVGECWSKQVEMVKDFVPKLVEIVKDSVLMLVKKKKKKRRKTALKTRHDEKQDDSLKEDGGDFECVLHVNGTDSKEVEDDMKTKAIDDEDDEMMIMMMKYPKTSEERRKIREANDKLKKEDIEAWRRRRRAWMAATTAR
eukprot:TRINITY_DN30578_c0_g1_i4.p1 TRINITY_DN30578_c0_g1~~TRINITY_DN30578_c0_g1_i4.p1  ORF type:complete len:256 (+),score=106.13 TRINITY_DN30578_c0_g1_i4:128-895(+)